MRIISLFLAMVFVLSTSVTQLSAQQADLVSNPAEDQFEFCKQLYREANGLKDLSSRQRAYQKLIPRLEAYIRKFPNHQNTRAISYYLGECYYHSGMIDQAKRVLYGMINKYRSGRYVALASSRLGYDEVAKKNYGQAAVHFGRVAEMASTAEERYRGRYQQASCYFYAGDVNNATRSFAIIASAQDIEASYRDGARLKLGNIYFDQKRYDKALTYFDPLMAPEVAEPARIEATLHVGLISLEKKDTQTAESCFKAVLLSQQDNFKPNAQTALMNSYYTAGKYSEVLDVIRVGDYPGTDKMESAKFMLVGRSAYQLKRYNDAIQYFAKAERQIPLSDSAFEAAYYRLLCFYNIEGANIPAQVDAFVEVYRARHPKHERIHKAILAKAETLFDQEQFREASAAYNDIDENLVGDENRANLLYKRGCSLAESGDHNSAVRDFTTFLSRYADDPRSPSVIARRGSSFLAMGDSVSALNDFDLLIQRYPKDKLASLALQSSAKIKKDAEDYEGMILRYEKLVREFPTLRKATLANAHYWIGWGRYQQQKYRDAITPLKESVKLDSDSYAFNAGMLIVYSAYSLKDKSSLQAAVESLKEIDKADRVPAPIYRWLGLQSFNAGQIKDSERYLTIGTTAHEPRQTPSTYWKMLGDARVKLGKFEQALVAIKNFLDVEEQPFWRAEAMYDQSEAYLGLGRLAEAKASAEEALALRPKGRLNADLRMVLGDIAYKNNEFAAAAAFYVVVVQLFVEDQELRPEALHKAYLALKKKGDSKEADHYLKLLNEEFPEYDKK